jgi:hypothetical protein
LADDVRRLPRARNRDADDAPPWFRLDRFVQFPQPCEKGYANGLCVPLDADFALHRIPDRSSSIGLSIEPAPFAAGTSHCETSESLQFIFVEPEN